MAANMEVHGTHGSEGHNVHVMCIDGLNQWPPRVIKFTRLLAICLFFGVLPETGVGLMQTYGGSFCLPLVLTTVLMLMVAAFGKAIRVTKLLLLLPVDSDCSLLGCGC